MVSGEYRTGASAGRLPEVRENLTPFNRSLKERVFKQLEARMAYFRETGAAPAEIRISLRPPSLGDVLVRVFSGKGRLSAEILVEALSVKELMESSLVELKHRFMEMNLQFEKVELFSADREPGGGGRFDRGALKTGQAGAAGPDDHLNPGDAGGQPVLPDSGNINLWA